MSLNERRLGISVWSAEVLREKNSFRISEAIADSSTSVTTHVDGAEYFGAWISSLRSAAVAAAAGETVVARVHAYRSSPELSADGLPSRETTVLAALAELSSSGADVRVTMSPHLGKVPNARAYRAFNAAGVPTTWGAGTFTRASHEKYSFQAVGDEASLFLGSLDPWTPRWDESTHLPVNHSRYRAHFTPSHDVGAELRVRRPGIAKFAATHAVSHLWPTFDSADATVMFRSGEREPSELVDSIASLIRSADRYLYIEDQYFLPRAVSSYGPVSHLLAAAISRGVHITVLVPGPSPRIAPRRILEAESIRVASHILSQVQPGAEGSLRVLGRLTGQGSKKVYVHSKLVIADGAAMVLGSANMNSRSMHYDSEIALRCSDRSVVSSLLHRLMSEHAIADIVLRDHADVKLDSSLAVELTNRTCQPASRVTNWLFDRLIDPLPPR